jgi:hypothetical protein
MLAYLDGSEEALAGVLRAGNAGANTAEDKIAVPDAALAQLPKRVAAREAILMRADSAGATHEPIDFCRDGRMRFSVGFDLTEPVRSAILAPAQDASVAAITQDGEPRDDDGAQVAEITEALDLTGWPSASRVIVRREIAHPGAQLSFTDHDGHRFHAILTDQPDTDIAYLEARHRGHARVEDRIKAGKDTGMDKLPFRDYAMNAVWLELSLIAQDLIAQTKALALEGEHARSEPKRLRYRLPHVAGRLAFHAKRSCTSTATGPRRASSRPPSNASPRCPRPRAETAPAPTDHDRYRTRRRQRPRRAVHEPTVSAETARDRVPATALAGIDKPTDRSHHSLDRPRPTVSSLMQDPG